MCLYLVGPPEDELRPRLRLSSVPGRTRPSFAVAYAPRLVIIGRSSAWVGAPANIVHNIKRGSSSPPSGRPGRSFTTETDLPLCCAWVWGGLERIAFFTPTTASSRWRLRRCWTGTVATTARRMVATSEGGGRPCRRSRPLRRRPHHSQYTT